MRSKRVLKALPVLIALASTVLLSGRENALAQCVRPDSFDAMVAGGPHSASTEFYDSIFIARVTAIRRGIEAGSPHGNTVMYEAATYDAIDMQLEARLLGSIPEHPTVMSREGMEDNFAASLGTTYVVAGHHNADGTFVTAGCMSQRVDANDAQSLKNVSDPRYVHTARDAIVGSGSSTRESALEVIGVLLAAGVAVAVLRRLRGSREQPGKGGPAPSST
ncbi:MAG: hypothetical protein ACJ76P_04380 [Actinomycetota bacterium]